MRNAKLTTWIFLLPALLFMVSACATTNKAKQGAIISQQMYEAVSNTVVEQIDGIVKASDAGSITGEQRKRLAVLSDFKKLLNNYAEGHNAYVAALKVAETSSQKNEDVGKQARELATLSGQIIEHCDKLGIKLP